jgi:hypothetical protein
MAEKAPCRLCGTPTVSVTGYCQTSKACYRQYHNAYLREWRTPAPVVKWCSVCGGPVRKDNKTGICKQTAECKRAANRAWAKAGRQRRAADRPVKATKAKRPAKPRPVRVSKYCLHCGKELRYGKSVFCCSKYPCKKFGQKVAGILKDLERIAA